MLPYVRLRTSFRSILFYFLFFTLILSQVLIFQLYFTVAVRIPFDPRLEPILETFPFFEVSNGPFVMKSFVWIYLLFAFFSLGVFFLKPKVIRIVLVSLSGIGPILLLIFVIFSNSYIPLSVSSDTLHVSFYWILNCLTIAELWTIIALNLKLNQKSSSSSNTQSNAQKILFMVVGLGLALFLTYIVSILFQKSLSWQFLMWTILLMFGGLYGVSTNKEQVQEIKEEKQPTEVRRNKFGIFIGLIFIVLSEYLFLQPLYLREIVEAKDLIVPYFPRYFLLSSFIALVFGVLCVFGGKFLRRKYGKNPEKSKSQWLFSNFTIICVGLFLFLLYALLRIWNISTGFYLDWESGLITNKPILGLGYLGIIPFVFGLGIIGNSIFRSEKPTIKSGINFFFWMLFLHLANWLLPMLLTMAGYYQGLMFFLDLLIMFLGIAFIIKSLRIYGIPKRIFTVLFNIHSKKTRIEPKNPIPKKIIVGISACLVLILIPSISSLTVFTNLPDYNPMIPRNVDWNQTLFVPVSIPGHPPEWAIAEYNALKAYREWVYYWLDNYREDHTFSGVFEDDVELVQSWSILPFITSDQRVNRTLFDFFETAWNSLYIKDGVWNRAPPGSDIEHIAEPISYLVPPAMLLDYNNETWIQKSL